MTPDGPGASTNLILTAMVRELNEEVFVPERTG